MLYELFYLILLPPTKLYFSKTYINYCCFLKFTFFLERGVIYIGGIDLLTEKFMPWISGYSKEKELILLSIVGGNPDTDKVAGGKIKVVLVTEPDLFIEQLVEGASAWAKDVSYCYFKDDPTNPFMTLAEQIPPKHVKDKDISHLILNKIGKKDDEISKARNYFKNINCGNDEQFLKEVEKLKHLKPIIGKKEEELLIDHFIRMRQLDSEIVVKTIPITPKTLITLKNLAEAQAKLNKRQKVSISDVKRAVMLFSDSYKQIWLDQMEILNDVESNTKMFSATGKRRLNELYFYMKKIADENGTIDMEKLKICALGLGIDDTKLEKCINELESSGYLAKAKGDRFEVL